MTGGRVDGGFIKWPRTKDLKRMREQTVGIFWANSSLGRHMSKSEDAKERQVEDINFIGSCEAIKRALEFF